MRTFDLYQQLALATAAYPLRGKNLLYPALKLAGEAGEAADKIGKQWRNIGKEGVISADDLPQDKKDALILELGDVLCYIAALADELGIPLEEIAIQNIEKLRGRHARGTIKGEGDNR